MVNLSRLEEIKDLRTVWPHEALDFTPWLSQDDNIALLAAAAGLDITVDETESPVGDFNVDIFASESGLTDNSSAMGFVPWRDVKRIYMVTMKHNKLIQVELERPEEYLDRLSGLSRKAAELNVKMGYQAISFSLNGTGKNPDKFLADIIGLWERNK